MIKTASLMASESELIKTLVFSINEIDGSDTTSFGGKGAGLARMSAASMPVPPAFVISTEAYRQWKAGGRVLGPDLLAQVGAALDGIEALTGKRLGGEGGGVPLLVSVRSGAKVSMPGMMDTVLNLGATGLTAHRLSETSGNPLFAADTLVRFWKMFGEIVLQLDGDELVAAVTEAHTAAAAPGSHLQNFADLEQALVAAARAQGTEPPIEPRAQLERSIAAVFESWDSRRARTYRQHQGIPDDLGTAVVVQAMVFGNLDANSGSGVAFSRNPNTGEPELYGEYLRGCQGEDIVSGSETPLPIGADGGLPAIQLAELDRAALLLEAMYRDAVDIEFTVESNRLYLLQVRAAKRSAQAAVRIALGLVDSGVLSASEGMTRVSTAQLDKLLKPSFVPEALASAVAAAVGIGSSPGHAVGAVVLDADRAANLAAAGERVILLRPTTSPQDIRGMISAEGIVTVRGGALSHAAVVSRALDKPCIVGCEAVAVDLDARTFSIAGVERPEGTEVSIDGTTGQVYLGTLPFQASGNGAGDVPRLLQIADEVSGCRYWLATAAPDRSALGAPSPEGFGPISLTDLIIAADRLDELIADITSLGKNPNDGQAQDRLRALSKMVCEPLLASAGAVPVDLRLPNLGSPRAQRLIGEWTSLAPQLLLPMGVRTFRRAMLAGIAEAAEATSAHAVNVVLGGVTSPGEVRALKALAPDGVGVGVVAQNMASLAAAVELSEACAVLWLDIAEITRSYYGFASPLSLADDVFEVYSTDGMIENNPRGVVAPMVADALAALTRASRVDAARIGVDCGNAVWAPSLISELYRTGIRRFSLVPSHAAGVRLTLGQISQEEKS
jgi:pyruvate, orthophosphate dikinase